MPDEYVCPLAWFWLGSAIVGGLIGDLRGHLGHGLAMSMLFGPLGVIATLGLPISPEREARRRRAIAAELRRQRAGQNAGPPSPKPATVAPPTAADYSADRSVSEAVAESLKSRARARPEREHRRVTCPYCRAVLYPSLDQPAITCGSCGQRVKTVGTGTGRPETQA